MSDVLAGVKSILAYPAAYDLWSRAVGGSRAQTIIVREHVRPWPRARILDLGCGTGELLDYLGDVTYTGVDVSDEYIARARDRRGQRASFLAGDATSLSVPARDFDRVVAIGVLHHLDDVGAMELLRTAATALRPDGRMITVDPTFVEGQNRAAWLAISLDRGRNVRTPEDYLRLAARSFTGVDSTVRGDLIRIPYTHCVLECTGPIQEEAVAAGVAVEGQSAHGERSCDPAPVSRISVAEGSR